MLSFCARFYRFVTKITVICTIVAFVRILYFVTKVTDACDNGVTVPALGLAWANLVTTKLHLSVDQDKVRNLQVLHAPHLAPAAAKFVIVESGISSVNLND